MRHFHVFDIELEQFSDNILRHVEDTLRVLLANKTSFRLFEVSECACFAKVVVAECYYRLLKVISTNDAFEWEFFFVGGNFPVFLFSFPVNAQFLLRVIDVFFYNRN